MVFIYFIGLGSIGVILSVAFLVNSIKRRKWLRESNAEQTSDETTYFGMDTSEDAMSMNQGLISVAVMIMSLFIIAVGIVNLN